jgi:subtilisin
MTRGRWTAIVLAAMLGVGGLATSSPLAEARSDVIPGSYIVVYKDSVDHVGRATRARENELGFDRDLLYSHALEGFSAELTPEQVGELRADSKVASVSPNGRIEGFADEPLAPGEPTPPTGTRRILSATTTTVRQAGANVAVLDSGIQLDHPDLNAAAGIDCVDPGTSPDDEFGHGTHVAGIIGAKNNGAGVTGVAPNTKVYAVRVLDSSNAGSFAQLICGIDWVTANHAALGIEVANMSLGGPAEGANPDGETCDTTTDPTRIAICNSTAAGVRYVAAAGNSSSAFDSGSVLIAPADYPEVLTVTNIADSDGAGGGAGPSTSCSSVIPDDTPAPSSNWAATPTGAAHTIAAPGTCINSTLPGSTYGVESGTSMASPTVAGAVALCVEEAGAAGPCSGETPAETIVQMRDSAKAYTAVRPSHGFAGDPDHSPTPGKHYGYMVHGPGATELINVTNTNDSGAGSLRAAIVAANADPGSNSIFFKRSLSGSIELESPLGLLEDAAILGPGADRVTVESSATAGDFAIAISTGVTADVSGLTIAGGNVGVYNLGDLTLREVEVRDNGFGGIFNDVGDLLVLRSTIADNDWPTGTGAAGIRSTGGTVAIQDSTIAGNEVHVGAAGSTGGVATFGGTTTIANSTIAANINPSGAANLSGATTTLKSTIVANPLGGGANCGGTVTSQGFNLESTDTCGLNQATDLTDADPQLAALGDNGGPTRTLLPLASSPAFDQGVAGSSSTDQRGETRTVDLPSAANAAGGDGTDIGAVELRPSLLQVTNTNDFGPGSLRDEITDANALAGADAITFAPGLTGTVNLHSELPALTGEVEIDGPGLEQFTVRRDTGGDYRIFTIATGVEAEISGLTVTNGVAASSPAFGGGVLNRGQLLLERVAVSSNSAALSGGGVFNFDGATLTLKASRISQNSTQGYGGGLGDVHPSVGGPATVLDSTISGNTATLGGAGIYEEDGDLTVRTSTVSGNTTGAGGDPRGAGGIWVYKNLPASARGAPVIADSTIAGNTHLGAGPANLTPDTFNADASVVKSTIIANPLGGGPNCAPLPLSIPGGTPSISSQGFNLESADSCGFSAPSDRTNQNPQLGPLADNGGPTQTMALPLASPAVDAGASTSGPNDQRGFARSVDQPGTPNAPGGNASDIGAFELQAQPPVSVPDLPVQPVQPKKKCKKGQKLKKGKCVKKKKRR